MDISFPRNRNEWIIPQKRNGRAVPSKAIFIVKEVILMSEWTTHKILGDQSSTRQNVYHKMLFRREWHFAIQKVSKMGKSTGHKTHRMRH